MVNSDRMVGDRCCRSWALASALGAAAFVLLLQPSARSSRGLSLAHISEAAQEPALRSHAAPLDAVLAGCGDICRTDIPGSPGKFFDYMDKKVDCIALLTNAAIDAAMQEAKPPREIPAHLHDEFTFGGRVRVEPHPGGPFNQRYLGSTAATAEWSRELVDDWKAKCEAGTLDGTYGTASTNALRDALLHVNIEGAHVLVVGSERPWVEACLLSRGAKIVTTIEYGGIKSSHPQVMTMTPAQARSRAHELEGAFDAVVTYSSIEHSGLGRYGDAMNPYGDRQTTARAWCMTRSGGRMLAGIPAEGAGTKDVIYYNAHRCYGPVQLPHLFANWRQVWSGRSDSVHRMWVVEKA